MKAFIYFTALGIMQSVPMEWPLPTNRRIELAFPIKGNDMMRSAGPIRTNEVRYKRAVFEPTGFSEVFTEGGRPAMEYTLVDVL
jgi:hypothetical protein